MPKPLAFDPIAEAGRQWTRNWGRRSAPPMMAVTSVMRVQQIMLSRLNAELDRFGLSFARYEALMLLRLSRRGSLPLGKMGARLQVHPTSVTSLVDGLEKLGYATRTPHPSDRRTTLATITDTGYTMASRATEALNAMRFGVGPLAPAELNELTRILGLVRVEAGDFAPDGT